MTRDGGLLGRLRQRRCSKELELHDFSNWPFGLQLSFYTSLVASLCVTATISSFYMH